MSKMNVYLSGEQAKELGLPDSYEYVRSAFYLGLPYLLIMNRCHGRCHQEERDETVERAYELGMNEESIVHYRRS